MTSRALVQLVAQRELRDRLGNRAFLLTTAISLLVIVGIIVAPSLLGGDDTVDVVLGVEAGADLPEGFDQAVANTAQAMEIDSVEVLDIGTAAAADEAVDDGDVDGVVIDERTLLVAEPNAQLEQLVAQSLQTANLGAFLTDAEVDPAQLQQASALPEIQITTPDGKDSSQLEQQFGVGFIVTVLLFLTLQINGASILTTTVEEKSSRVVEVLLGTLRPWQLLSGKLIAMTLLSVAQLVLYAGAALAASMLVGSVDLPPTTLAVMAVSIPMFLVGFGLYASIYAVAGALAGSAEEAQSAAAPIGFISAAVYMAVLIGVVPDPNGLFAQILTYIPFSAPFAVPVRVGAGMPMWQAALGFISTTIGLVVTVRVAGRLYSAAILAGGRLTWRGALKAEPIR